MKTNPVSEILRSLAVFKHWEMDEVQIVLSPRTFTDLENI
jgi:hypothetical protein